VDSFANIGRVEKYLTVSWWQWVFFAEVGRVAPSWNFSKRKEIFSHRTGLALIASFPV
jgi:hypothetical protein